MAAAIVSYGQENRMPMGMLTSRATIAIRNEVRAELGLTGEQWEQINELLSSLNNLKVGASLAGPLPAFEELDAKVKSLLSEEQWQRLMEVWIQYEGPFTLQSDTIANALEINPDTRQKIGVIGQSYAAWWQSQVGKVRTAGDLARIRREARKSAGQMLKLLTPDQKKKFEGMQGKKFRFAF